MDQQEQKPTLNLAEWYTAREAADRLHRNSGKPVSTAYPRKLVEYGKIRAFRINERNSLYYKPDIDAYIVEEPGEKSARAKRQKAKPKPTRKQKKQAA